MDTTIPTHVADAAMKLLTSAVFLGTVSAFLTWLLIKVLNAGRPDEDPIPGENWRRFISNTMPIVVVIAVIPLGAWRGWFAYTDDLAFNALVGAVCVGWGKQWVYTSVKAGTIAVNKIRGVENPDGA